VALTAGVPRKAIAERFGVPVHSLKNHSRFHLTLTQRAAILSARKPSPLDPDQLAAQEGAGLLGGLVVQRTRLLSDADAARQCGDVTAAARAEAGVLANYGLVAKLVGKLTHKIDVTHNHNLMLSEDWLRLRSDLMTALRPFPDALRAVVEAVQRREGDAARDITDAARPAPLVIEHEPAPLLPCPVPLP
jgi:hypothetical protein